MNYKKLISIFLVLSTQHVHTMQKIAVKNRISSSPAYYHSPGTFHRDISPRGTTLRIQKDGRNNIMELKIPEQLKNIIEYKNETNKQNTRLHNTQ